MDINVSKLFAVLECSPSCVFLIGSSHKFKKLCEKLQAILLSNERYTLDKSRRSSSGSTGGVYTGGKKGERASISGAYVISDTESEGELLSPEREGKPSIHT